MKLNSFSEMRLPPSYKTHVPPADFAINIARREKACVWYIISVNSSNLSRAKRMNNPRFPFSRAHNFLSRTTFDSFLAARWPTASSLKHMRAEASFPKRFDSPSSRSRSREKKGPKTRPCRLYQGCAKAIQMVVPFNIPSRLIGTDRQNAISRLTFVTNDVLPLEFSCERRRRTTSDALICRRAGVSPGDVSVIYHRHYLLWPVTSYYRTSP